MTPCLLVISDISEESTLIQVLLNCPTEDVIGIFGRVGN
jgi:hypothetical protein